MIERVNVNRTRLEDWVKTLRYVRVVDKGVFNSIHWTYIGKEPNPTGNGFKYQYLFRFRKYFEDGARQYIKLWYSDRDIQSDGIRELVHDLIEYTHRWE
jgi:hypothetical protein